MLFKLFYKLENYRVFFSIIFFRFYYRIFSKIYNFRIGKKVLFFGKMKISKNLDSHLIIDDNCVFRSNYDSNLIGINRPCIISLHHKNTVVKIGKNSGFSGTVIGAFDKIIIGNNVMCGANTLITDSDWHQDDPRSSPPRPIIIGDNVWLGVNAVVLKGVTIGENSVIGANSLVVKDIPANVIAAGNPCKVIKSINNNG